MKHILLPLALLALPLHGRAEEAVADSTLQDVVVTGTRDARPEQAILSTVSTLTRHQLAEAGRVSILPTLSELVPGVFVTQRAVAGFGVSGGAAGTISVRGLSAGSGQAMVLVDGHPQYQGIYGHSIADACQTMAAERVEVVRGPASLLYGSNAMGGVVNIITRRPPEGKAVRSGLQLGAGSYGTVQAEARNSARFGRLFSDLALNYQCSDNHRPSMDFCQYGGAAKLGYDFSSRWTAWAQLDMTHFAASNPGAVSSPLLDARQWVNRGVAQLAVENHYATTSGALTVYHNFGRHKINDGHAPDADPRDYLFRSQDALTGVSIHQGLAAWKGAWLTLGADYQNIHGECWNQSIATSERLNRPMEQNMHYPLLKDLTELAAYADLRQDITPWWTLEAGIRYDRHSEAGGEWVPQGGFVFRPLDGGQLKLSAAKGFRVPNLREMYLYAVANPDLQPERLVNYELAWKHRLLHTRLTYGVNLFYMHVSNLIATTMVPQLGRAANYNTGKRDHLGAEAEASWRADSHWTLHTNHSYLHMDSPLPAAPEYKGYLGAAYAAGRLELQAGCQYLAGLCTNLDTEDKQHVALLNASAAYNLFPEVRLWLRGENLLAQRYQINDGFPMPKATVMAGIGVQF